MALLITAFHVLAQENGGRYLFDPTECVIVERAMCCSDNGLMDYPHIPETDVMKAFVKAQNSTRIDSFFRGLNDEHYAGMFYNVFDSGELIRMADWRRFEMRYLLDALEKWLDENGIPHYADHEDERLKEVL